MIDQSRKRAIVGCGSGQPTLFGFLSRKCSQYENHNGRSQSIEEKSKSLMANSCESVPLESFISAAASSSTGATVEGFVSASA